jgi:hypothetical protein
MFTGTPQQTNVLSDLHHVLCLQSFRFLLRCRLDRLALIQIFEFELLDRVDEDVFSRHVLNETEPF